MSAPATVLVVDDERPLVELVASYLRSEGFRVLRAYDGLSALDLACTVRGVGIAAGRLPHVFDRFYRADPSRSPALCGSGVGLTIAKALVETHGGRIRVESAGAGQGATFSFTLPRLSRRS